MINRKLFKISSVLCHSVSHLPKENKGYKTKEKLSDTSQVKFVYFQLSTANTSTRTGYPSCFLEIKHGLFNGVQALSPGMARPGMLGGGQEPPKNSLSSPVGWVVAPATKGILGSVQLAKLVINH